MAIEPIAFPCPFVTRHEARVGTADGGFSSAHNYKQVRSTFKFTEAQLNSNDRFMEALSHGMQTIRQVQTLQTRNVRQLHKFVVAGAKKGFFGPQYKAFDFGGDKRKRAAGDNDNDNDDDDDDDSDGDDGRDGDQPSTVTVDTTTATTTTTAGAAAKRTRTARPVDARPVTEDAGSVPAQSNGKQKKKRETKAERVLRLQKEKETPGLPLNRNRRTYRAHYEAMGTAPDTLTF